MEIHCDDPLTVGARARDLAFLRDRHQDVRERSPTTHFHVRYGSFRCAIDPRTMEVMHGNIPRRALALTLEWAVEHREALMEDWDLCATGQNPKPIPPLE